MLQFGGKLKKSSSDLKRHFTVVIDSGGKGGTNVPPKEHGLYVSSTPSLAAKKAVTKLCAANKSKKVEFHIREITQGSKKKTYGPYVGYIEKLKEPIELKGHVIKYKSVAKLSIKTGKKKRGMMRGGGYDATLSVNKNILYILDSQNHDSNISLVFTITNKETRESINYTSIRCLGEGTYGKVFLVENDKKPYVIKITRKNVEIFIKESTILDSFMNQVNYKCQYKAVSQGISIINGIPIGHIIFPYKGGFELFKITLNTNRDERKIILIPKILRDVLTCLIDINKYAIHGDIKLENIVYDDTTKTGFIIDFGLATIFPITIETLYTINIGQRQLSIDIIIGYLEKNIKKNIHILDDLYSEDLVNIQKTIDNFGLFWIIIESISNLYILDNYITNRDFIIHSNSQELFDIYLNFYFNLDNIKLTPLRVELEKLFNYTRLPDFRQIFINNVFTEMKPKKFEIYFKSNKESFDTFMEKVLALIRVDAKTRIPKEILLEDPFFQII